MGKYLRGCPAIVQCTPMICIPGVSTPACVQDSMLVLGTPGKRWTSGSKPRLNWGEYGRSIITVRHYVFSCSFPHTGYSPQLVGEYTLDTLGWLMSACTSTNYLHALLIPCLCFPDALPRIIGTLAEYRLSLGPAKHK